MKLAFIQSEYEFSTQFAADGWPNNLSNMPYSKLPFFSNVCIKFLLDVPIRLNIESNS